MRSALLFIGWAATACYSGIDRDPSTASSPQAEGGSEGSGGSTESDGEPMEPEEVPTLATHGGLRRLTLHEYDNALRDLLRDESRPAAEYFPADPLTPFDNDYLEQSPSEAVVLGAEKLAIEAADRLLADPARLDALVGCDAAELECVREFVARFGRRAFRRPLEPAEIEALASLHAVGIEAGDARVGAAAIVRAMLQDPNFLYRVEIGTPIEGAPGIVALDDWELATRLSFFLWGTIPDDALLDRADDDGLSSADDVRAQADRMLDDPRARATVDRFHALWLGYARFSDAGLAADMVRESNALVERVVFDDAQSWLALFESTETFVTATLADHYGLPAPDGDAGWVDYGESGRGGILSHGTLLALGAKFGDTSPTVRGVQLRERLFCHTIKVPQDLNVNVDDPPGVDPAACKWDRYAAHREVGLCSGCHALIDGIGFGLENYDAAGAFRSHDVDKPQCEITGEGDLPEVGAFNGPAELGRILPELTQVRECAVTQLYRYTSGRRQPDDLDEAFIESLTASHDDRELDLRDLMVELAASEAFRFRVVAEED